MDRGRAAALRERELTIERLRARIQALAGGGIDERLAAARRRFDELARECAKYQREVEALELLLRVLRDAERDAKERYVGPLVRRIRPIPQGLFPGADLEVDEAFRITAIARSGGPEPLERLSEGTREQIAILTRLAFAELLADQGRPRWWCWTTRWCSRTTSGSSRCSRSWPARGRKPPDHRTDLPRAGVCGSAGPTPPRGADPGCGAH